MLDQIHGTATAVYLLDLCIRIGLSVRVIKRRLAVGVALAWLSVILILPLAGAVLYLLFGEYRLGRGRTRRAAQLAVDCQRRFPQFYSTGAAGDSVPTAGGEALARVAEALLGAPPLPGNRLELLPNAEAAFPVLLADIDQYPARHTTRRGPDESLGHLVGTAAGAPDVKLQVARLGRPVDVGQEGGERGLGVGQQFEPVARQGRRPE